jgi:hypothetical protein
MVRHLNGVGLISTPLHLVPRKWVPVTDVIQSTITSVTGIGRKSPQWVRVTIADNLYMLMKLTGATLLKKIAEAVPERNDHQDDFEELDSSLAAKYPEQLLQWKKEVEAWEADASNPNPFEVKNDCMYTYSPYHHAAGN